jgi:quercetin dioxygenase-like cupin family protein
VGSSVAVSTVRSRVLGVLCALSLSASAFAADSDEEMGHRVQALLRANQADIYRCVAAQQGVVEGEALLRMFAGGDEPSRVEVLKADDRPAVRRAADCVADRARHWKISTLGASEGDQIVFPLAFRPEPPRTDAIGVRVQELTPPKKPLATQLSHVAAFYVLGPTSLFILGAAKGAAAKAKAGDVVMVEPQPTFTYAGSAVLRIDATSDSVRPEGVPQVELVELGKLPTLPLPGGQGTVQLYLDGKPAPFAVDRLCAPKGAAIPRHQHDSSDEVVYILSGHVRTMIGDHETVSGPHDIVTIPRGTPHAMNVTEDLCAVQIYAPAGPEQRFKPRTTP